ncbi:hypothetical protein BX661DRAFT_67405 [Kickxella alabastrina]|uniref:uncharacterized protein n=1 Tax=Kickxella alabastrina TaxID=61397 RepID=UPI00221FD0A9|nr:uncharacterized protein BX661DRAFT_67405 [Kickxella alabastrina]KAI7821455.1 hypothetical protein BX661DRAFT_67405 [Kickxella alabastrina]
MLLLIELGEPLAFVARHVAVAPLLALVSHGHGQPQHSLALRQSRGCVLCVLFNAVIAAFGDSRRFGCCGQCCGQGLCCCGRTLLTDNLTLVFGIPGVQISNVVVVKFNFFVVFFLPLAKARAFSLRAFFAALMLFFKLFLSSSPPRSASTMFSTSLSGPALIASWSFLPGWSLKPLCPADRRLQQPSSPLFFYGHFNACVWGVFEFRVVL